MYELTQASPRPRRQTVPLRTAAAALFSVALGATGPAFAAPHGGGFHGGGFHGGGFHGGGFHGGGFHGGGFHGGGFHGGGFHGGGFHAERFHGGFHGDHFHGGYFHHGWGYGFYPGLGLGFALGAAYPWDWGYYQPDYGYYSYSEPYAGQVWYYCANPPGYYPYVSQCYTPWQVVPAS
jgi:hypothetical protein